MRFRRQHEKLTAVGLQIIWDGLPASSDLPAVGTFQIHYGYLFLGRLMTNATDASGRIATSSGLEITGTAARLEQWCAHRECQAWHPDELRRE